MYFDLTNWFGPTNPFVKSKQFVKSTINFCKGYGIKIPTLRHTDMKKEFLLFTTSLKVISYALGDQLLNYLLSLIYYLLLKPN